MKWKMSTITPNIVKSTILRSGFRLIDGTVLRATLTYRSHSVLVFQPMVSVSPLVTTLTLFERAEGNDWLGTWSRHMKPICFKVVRDYQKVG